jgi:LysM repeat protein
MSVDQVGHDHSILERVTRMRSWKRLIFFLLLNVMVSVLATMGVISWWERNQPATSPLPEITPITGQGGVVAGTGGTDPVNPQNPPVYDLYIVQFGDSMGSIAERFNVSVEALLQVNGLNDPNALGVGQQLFIPINSNEPEAAEEGVQQPVAEATPLIFSSDNPQIEIAAVVGAGDLATERVILRHIGEMRVPLLDWRLRNERGDEYVFPQLDLHPGGTVNIYTIAGVDTVVSLYWGLERAAWNAREGLTLLDPQGNVHATYAIP